MPETITGYKGFDQNMRCRGYQYEGGEEYIHEGSAVACQSGFHFCENPLDVFGYYSPGESVFHAVEGSGQIAKHNDDSKVSCTKIKVGPRLSLHDFIGASIKFLFSREYEASGSKHVEGHRSASSATGDRSASSATGDASAAVVTGPLGKAMAGKYGCVALGWWNDEEKRSEMRCAETGCGDGSDGKLKAETWYQLNDNGEFEEVPKS